MEISKKELKDLIALVGETELKKVIPSAFPLEYNENKIYILKGINNSYYKLHRLDGGGNYAFISLQNSDCYANGVDSVNNILKYGGDNLFVFDTYRDYIVWSFKNLDIRL